MYEARISRAQGHEAIEVIIRFFPQYFRYDVQHGNDAGIIQVLGSYFVQYFSPSGLNPLVVVQ